MQVNGASSPLFGGQLIDPVVRARKGPRADVAPIDPRTRLDQLGAVLDTLRNGVRQLRSSAGFTLRAGGQAALELESSDALGLDLDATTSSAASLEEINSVPTSYGTHEPEFAGLSSADPLVTGVYDGSLGDQTLTFRVRTGALVGTNDFDVEVRDAGGSTLETLTFSKDDPAEQATSFGLTLGFGSGALVLNDTFELEVSASVGTVVDPDAAFDGNGDDAPEFDPGFAVTAGSFEINGVSIGVLASDSIQTVLGRINASAAGVTAVFDAASERIQLTSQTSGSVGTIVLGADSSGFLAATKLAQAGVVGGDDADDVSPIAGVGALAGIQSGTLTINGVEVAIDVDQDSLQDVLARIQAAAPGVALGYDPISDRVTLTSSGALSIDSGSSGFFEAVGLSDGDYQVSSEKRFAPGTFARAGSLYDGLRGLALGLEELFSVELHPSAAGVGELARAEFASAIALALGSDAETLGEGLVRSGFGFDFDLSKGQRRPLQVDAQEVKGALEVRRGELVEFLAASESGQGHKGLVERLDDALSKVQAAFDSRVAVETEAGTSLDVLA